MLDRLRRWLFPPDEWHVIRAGPNAERAVVESGLDHPPDPDLYLADHDLDPGTYRCQAVRNKQFAEMEWSREIGDPHKAREIEKLERQIQDLRSSVSRGNGGQQSVEEMIRREKAKLALGALNSEKFVNRYGEQIALSMFDSGSGRDGVEFDEAMENPVGAAIWELKEDPNKVSDITRALLEGALSVDELADAENADTPVQDDSGESGVELGGVDAGPATLDDLGAAQDLDENDDDDVTRGTTPAAQQKFEELEGGDESRPLGETPIPPTPETAAELEELSYEQKAALAGDRGYDGNPWSTPESELADWLHAELVDDREPATSDPSAGGAEAVADGGDPDEEPTEKEVAESL